MSKTITVGTIEELRGYLKSDTLLPSYKGFKIECVTTLRSSYLRIDLAGESVEYALRFVLRPERKLPKSLDQQEEPLIFSPSIPNKLAADYRQFGIPHGDLNGRLFFIREGEGKLVDIRPAEKRYSIAKQGRDLFSSKATRLVRAFLSRRDHQFTQEELVNDLGISRTLVSQLLQKLCQEGYVEQIGEGSKHTPAHYLTAEFDELLEEWILRDKWEKRVEVHQFSVLTNDLVRIMDELGASIGYENIAFTQWIAAWRRRPYTTPPVVSAYLKNQALLDAVPGRPVKSGGNLWILLPKDEGVWQYAQESDGIPLVSDVQIYMDLLQVGLRGPDQAAELREWNEFTR